MIIEKTAGNIETSDLSGKIIDTVTIDWYEADKRILKKTSSQGVEIGIRMKGEPSLRDGDILWTDEKSAIVVEIAESDCISLSPENFYEMGILCYEIGNRHAPILIRGSEVLTPFDEPMFAFMQKSGFKPRKKKAKMDKIIGSHSHGHGHS